MGKPPASVLFEVLPMVQELIPCLAFHALLKLVYSAAAIAIHNIGLNKSM